MLRKSIAAVFFETEIDLIEADLKLPFCRAAFLSSIFRNIVHSEWYSTRDTLALSRTENRDMYQNAVLLYFIMFLKFITKINFQKYVPKYYTTFQKHKIISVLS